VANLIVSRGASDKASLAGALTVSDCLTLSSGILAIGANTLTLAGDYSSYAMTGSMTGGSSASLVLNGSGDLSLTSSLTELSSLTLSCASGSVATLQADLTIDSSLTLSGGCLSIGSHSLYFASGAVCTVSGGHEGESYIITDGVGSVYKYFSLSASSVSFSFEIGTGNGYSPLTVTIPGGTSAGSYVAARSVAEKPSSVTSNNYVSRYWSLSSGGVGSASVSASYLSSDIHGTESSMKGCYSPYSVWTQFGTVNAATHSFSGSLSDLNVYLTAFGNSSSGGSNGSTGYNSDKANYNFSEDDGDGSATPPGSGDGAFVNAPLPNYPDGSYSVAFGGLSMPPDGERDVNGGRLGGGLSAFNLLGGNGSGVGGQFSSSASFASFGGALSGLGISGMGRGFILDGEHGVDNGSSFTAGAGSVGFVPDGERGVRSVEPFATASHDDFSSLASMDSSFAKHPLFKTELDAILDAICAA